MVLIAVSLGFLGLMLIAPLLVVFVEAFSRGLGVYFDALALPDTMAALQLTLLVAVIAVPAQPRLRRRCRVADRQVRFQGQGVPAHADRPAVRRFAGRVWPDLRAAVRRQQRAGPVAGQLWHQGLFAVPGIVLATIFITFPFIARELIPLMQQQGSSEEEAAVSLGASGWRTFFQVTLPNVKWGLLYGVLLCNARAMGEFGAVSVVSGHIRGVTNTLPLHIEILYNDNKAAAAFAVASLLAMLALVTLAVKTLLEARFAGEIAAQRRH
jgi:sulfate transport system permease protein